jgi:succinate dehydrogenase / fumarate reductase membrane anchor subunit
MVTPRRIVVGAHYGLGGWLAQRITAVIMALYSLILLGVFMSRRPDSYGAWRELFSSGWMRVATLLFAASLAWHAWVGVRDIVMDYIKPDGLRLGLEVVTILVLASYFGWTVQILWR